MERLKQSSDKGMTDGTKSLSRQEGMRCWAYRQD